MPGSCQVAIQAPSDTQLAQQVVLSLVDVTGSSVRAAHGLLPPPDGRTEKIKLDVNGIENTQPAFQYPGEECLAQLTNIWAPGASSPQVSIISLNFHVPQPLEAHVAAALVRLIQQLAPAGAQVTVAAAMVLLGAAAASSGSSGTQVQLLALNGARVPEALAAAPQLPKAAKVQDGLLAVLLHMLGATGVPTLGVVVRDHKPSVTSQLEDTAAGVEALGAALSKAHGCSFDAASSASCKLLHRWWLESRETGGEAMYL